MEKYKKKIKKYTEKKPSHNSNFEMKSFFLLCLCGCVV